MIAEVKILIETFIADKNIIELFMKMCLFEMHN